MRVILDTLALTILVITATLILVLILSSMIKDPNILLVILILGLLLWALIRIMSFSLGLYDDD